MPRPQDRENWEIGKLRDKLAELKARRKEVYSVNGKSWLTLHTRSGDSRVPADFLENWIKQTEVDLGLLIGRSMEP